MKKLLIVALLLVAPWLALAGCKKAALDAGFVPAAVTQTVHELPPIVVTAPVVKHVVKHSPKRRHVKHVAPAPVEAACHDLDVVCHLIKATR